MTLIINGWAKLSMTVLFTLGFISIGIVGLLKADTPTFLMIFSSMGIMETLMIQNLFKEIKTNGLNGK